MNAAVHKPEPTSLQSIGGRGAKTTEHIRILNSATLASACSFAHPLADVQGTRPVVGDGAVIDAREDALGVGDAVDEEGGRRSVDAEDNGVRKPVRQRCTLRRTTGVQQISTWTSRLAHFLTSSSSSCKIWGNYSRTHREGRASLFRLAERAVVKGDEGR